MKIELTGLEIAFMTNKQKRGVLQKAVRQQWPYRKKPHSHGSPIHIYSLKTLPKVIQIAWANWDEARYKEVYQAEEQKGKSGRKDKVPQPVTFEQARAAIKWPLRTTYTIKDRQKVEKDQEVEKVEKVEKDQEVEKVEKVEKDQEAEKVEKDARLGAYDGKSEGLCAEAKSALVERFDSLKNWLETTSDGSSRYVKEKKEKPVSQPQTDLLPDNSEHRDPSFTLIEKPARICPNCDFGVYADEYEEHRWCPLCREKVKLLDHCPECGKKIQSPRYNGCPFCGARFRKRLLLLPPK